MIDINSAIHDHRACIRSAADKLRCYARAFDMVGNVSMAGALSVIADDIEDSASRVTQAWYDELSRVVRYSDKALVDTLVAAFKR